jgi:hypothetical protein
MFEPAENTTKRKRTTQSRRDSGSKSSHARSSAASSSFDPAQVGSQEEPVEEAESGFDTAMEGADGEPEPDTASEQEPESVHPVSGAADVATGSGSRCNLSLLSHAYSANVSGQGKASP